MFRSIFLRLYLALVCLATATVSHAIPSTVIVNYTLGSDETASGDLTIQSGTVNLNGYTLTVTGTLRQTAGTLTLNGGTTQRGAPNLNIGGDFLVMTSGTRNADGTWTSVTASTGCIYSTNVGDWIRVGGEFVEAGGGDNYFCSPQWSNGLLELKGNFTQLPGSGFTGGTFNSQAGHVVKLIGDSTQAIRLTVPGSNKFTKLFVMANTDLIGLSRVSLRLGLNFPWTLYEITTYRPYGHAMGAGQGEVVGRAVIPVWVTEGIHPRVLAVSNTLGNLFHGRAATASNGARQDLPAWNDSLVAEDQDLSEDIWWDPRRGGTGSGYNINAILPIQPAPLVGMQAWYDTVCTIRKV